MLRLLCLGILLGSLALAQPEDNLVGTVRDRTYFSPTGAYSVVIPVLKELGGTVSDRENVVVFQDGYNVHISIGCFPQDATQRWELSTRGVRDYLAYFFATFAFPDFQQMFPGSQVERMEFMPGMVDGALLIYTLLPGGTMFANRLANVGPDTPMPVAKRGNLLFLKHGHVYVISLELAERSLEGSAYRKTREEEDAILKQRLEVLLDNLFFRRPPAERPAP